MVSPEIVSFYFLINLLYVILFKFHILGDKVSQNLETCEFTKPMILLDRDLKYFSGVNFLMTFLHAQSTVRYFLNRQTLCLWFLTSSDKIAVVGAGLGMTG